MRRLGKAFTAIELMVVIAIIMILMGLLVPVVTKVQKQAQQKLALAKLKGLKLAIERFYQDFGRYPPDTGHFVGHPVFGGLDPGYADSDGSPDDPYSLYRYLCGPGENTAEPAGEGILSDGRVYGPYITFEDSELYVDPDLEPWQKIVLDPWGNPWIYEEHYSHTQKKAQDAALMADLAKRGSFRYDIFSVGMDGEMAALLHDYVDNDGDGKFDEQDEGGDADDITTWSK